MTLFWKGIAAVLVAVVLGLHIGKQEREFQLLLTMTVCALGAAAAMTMLEPVMELLRELEGTIQIQSELMGTLLKCAGIALVAELADLICQDSGSSSLGKLVRLLGSAAVLYLSIPMVRSLLSLLRDILGDL